MTCACSPRGAPSRSGVRRCRGDGAAAAAGTELPVPAGRGGGGRGAAPQPSAHVRSPAPREIPPEKGGEPGSRGRASVPARCAGPGRSPAARGRSGAVSMAGEQRRGRAGLGGGLRALPARPRWSRRVLTLRGRTGVSDEVLRGCSVSNRSFRS